MNIVSGLNDSAALPTIAFISSAIQSDDSFDGMVRWSGPYAAFMLVILMPTLLSEVVRDGLGSLFATLWMPCGLFSATAPKKDGVRRVWQKSFRGREFIRWRNCQLDLRGPTWGGFLRDWM